MTVALITLAILLCASLMACSYLYATHRANARLVRRQDKEKTGLERRNTALLDRVLQRHGSSPISRPDEQPGPAQSFIPSSPWEAEWEAQEREDEARGALLAGIHSPDLTPAQKEELRRRAEEALNK